MKLSRVCCVLLFLVGGVAHATPLYFNGFEVDTASWTGATRVPSGTNGVTSADGSFHAVTGSGAYTLLGGYNYGAGGGVPTAFQEYYTSVDIFLDVDGGWANDTRFDVDSAINNSAGNFLQDFIFNAGFYNDATGPGAGTNRFIISASNNSSPGSAYPKNPGRDPIAIDTTGWYTFEHHFYENGSGNLAVDMSIYDASNTLIHTWQLGNTTAIAGVGGNRYMWFPDQDFSALAFDNSTLTLAAAPVPEPATITVLGMGLGAFALSRMRKRRG
ncbi:MAG: PEP-CTERM sorting domain-containing protein [Candidatus Hydrogenedentes bacterium]|nr:PEP-CTERM sorting domain-containing protein [Candidatus Hydrogenedentota bacterium]